MAKHEKENNRPYHTQPQNRYERKLSDNQDDIKDEFEAYTKDSCSTSLREKASFLNASFETNRPSHYPPLLNHSDSYSVPQRYSQYQAPNGPY